MPSNTTSIEAVMGSAAPFSPINLLSNRRISPSRVRLETHDRLFRPGDRWEGKEPDHGFMAECHPDAEVVEIGEHPVAGGRIPGARPDACERCGRALACERPQGLIEVEGVGRV